MKEHDHKINTHHPSWGDAISAVTQITCSTCQIIRHWVKGEYCQESELEKQDVKRSRCTAMLYFYFPSTKDSYEIYPTFKVKTLICCGKSCIQSKPFKIPDQGIMGRIMDYEREVRVWKPNTADSVNVTIVFVYTGPSPARGPSHTFIWSRSCPRTESSAGLNSSARIQFRQESRNEQTSTSRSDLESFLGSERLNKLSLYQLIRRSDLQLTEKPAALRFNQLCAVWMIEKNIPNHSELKNRLLN